MNGAKKNTLGLQRGRIWKPERAPRRVHLEDSSGLDQGETACQKHSNCAWADRETPASSNEDNDRVREQEVTGYGRQTLPVSSSGGTLADTAFGQDRVGLHPKESLESP